MEDTGAYEYIAPVAQLLTYGKPDVFAATWLDYREQGLSEEHIPDLIRVAINEEFNHGDEDNATT